MRELLQEPFSGLWNRRGDPILDGGVRLAELLGPVGMARPCREKVGNPDPALDDLIFVLPPGRSAPTLSPEMLQRMLGALDRGLAVLIWATHPTPIAAVRHRLRSALPPAVRSGG